ncbi:sulfotransferase family protein [Flavobacterium notoginsengisoli]|uniref:sulfotransferase family protein n=1 Tax=Flavobacterium notoginsengisoli TaxID=1478199 RepID=UPI0036374854
MENNNHALFNWIPYKLIEKNDEVYFEWVYLSDLKITDPFFDETIAKCKSHEYNSKKFKPVSSAENIIQWSSELISVDLKALVFHVSRCGSTMLSQSLATSSENIMISEAPIFDEILRSDYFSPDIKAVLIKAVLKFLGQKRFPEQKNLIFKLDAWHIFKVSYLRKLFPEIPFTLLYRNPVEVLKSHQKLPGLHMVPGLIPSAVFGIKIQEMQSTHLHQYQALVLEKYFKGFLDFFEIDEKVTLLNYNEGMKGVIEKFISFVKINYSETECDKMFERLKRHSKDESAVFTGDSFKEEALNVDFLKLNRLHEKLNNMFLDSVEL